MRSRRTRDGFVWTDILLLVAVLLCMISLYHAAGAKEVQAAEKVEAVEVERSRLSRNSRTLVGSNSHSIVRAKSVQGGGGDRPQAVRLAQREELSPWTRGLSRLGRASS